MRILKSAAILIVGMNSATSLANVSLKADAQTDSSKDFRCNLSYSEYFAPPNEDMKERWERPLTRNEKGNFEIEVSDIPFASLPKMKISVHPYELYSTPSAPSVGLAVFANNVQVQGNLRPAYRQLQNDREPESACHFQLGWSEFPQIQDGVWSRWLTLNCFAPLNYCHWSDLETRHPSDRLLADEEAYCEPRGEAFGVRAVWVRREGEELKLSTLGRGPRHVSFTAPVERTGSHVFAGSDFSLTVDPTKNSEHRKVYGRFTGRGADNVLMSCLVRQ